MIIWKQSVGLLIAFAVIAPSTALATEPLSVLLQRYQEESMRASADGWDDEQRAAFYAKWRNLLSTAADAHPDDPMAGEAKAVLASLANVLGDKVALETLAADLAATATNPWTAAYWRAVRGQAILEQAGPGQRLDPRRATEAADHLRASLRIFGDPTQPAFTIDPESAALRMIDSTRQLARALRLLGDTDGAARALADARRVLGGMPQQVRASMASRALGEAALGIEQARCFAVAGRAGDALATIAELADAGLLGSHASRAVDEVARITAGSDLARYAQITGQWLRERSPDAWTPALRMRRALAVRTIDTPAAVQESADELADLLADERSLAAAEPGGPLVLEAKAALARARLRLGDAAAAKALVAQIKDVDPRNEAVRQIEQQMLLEKPK